MNFNEVIEELDHGRVHQQLSETLGRIVDGVQTHGEPGEIKLTLKVKKEGDRCLIAVSTSSKIPTEPLQPSIFWFDNLSESPGLTRDDPRQMTLKTLDKPKVKEVDRG